MSDQLKSIFTIVCDRETLRRQKFMQKQRNKQIMNPKCTGKMVPPKYGANRVIHVLINRK